MPQDNAVAIPIPAPAPRPLAPVPYAPRDLGELMRLAQQLSDSQLVPKALRGKPADIMLVCMHGHDLGLSPSQALASIYVIEGKAVCSAQLMIACCLRRPDICRYFRLVASTDELATYETHRTGDPEPTRLSWTFGQAERAGLAKKDNWLHHRAAMLRARAGSALARERYPDLVAGLYTADDEELEIARTEARVAVLEQARATPKPAAQIAAEAEDWSQEAAEALRRTAPAVSHADADRAIVEADA